MKECQVPTLGQMEIVVEWPNSGKVPVKYILSAIVSGTAGPSLLLVAFD